MESGGLSMTDTDLTTPATASSLIHPPAGYDRVMLKISGEALMGDQGFGQTTATADADTPTAGSDEPTCSDLSLPDDVPLPVDVTTASTMIAQTAIRHPAMKYTAPKMR